MFNDAHDGEHSSPALCGYHHQHQHQHHLDQQDRASTSWRSRRRHRHGRSTTASSAREMPDRLPQLTDAPHCLTCYCLPVKPTHQQIHHDGSEATSLVGAGDYPRPSSRRSGRASVRKSASTTVDELIREMSLKGSLQQPAKLAQRAQSPPTATAAVHHQVEEEEEEEREEQRHEQQQQQHQSGVGDYCREAELRPGTSTARSCERWPAAAQRLASSMRSNFVHVSNVEPRRSEGPPSSITETLPTAAAPAPAVTALSSPAKLHLEEDEEDEEDEELEEEEEDEVVVVEPQPEPEPEAHVRELKLVRCEFIERILEETQKLHRLQRHLDGCSPRARLSRQSSLQSSCTTSRTRTVSTMTPMTNNTPKPVHP